MTEMNTNQEVFHPWKISEPKLLSDRIRGNAHYASLFALGNGYLGIRGSHDDALPGIGGPEGIEDQTGTFLNGFYESADIQYGEIAFGYAKESQTLLNIANPLPVSLEVDGVRLSFYQAFRNGEISEYQRELSMSDSILERGFIWTYSPGKRLMISNKRFVSQQQKELAVSSYRIFALDADVDITIGSFIDGMVSNRQGGEDPRVGSGLKGRSLINDYQSADLNKLIISLQQHTRRSGMRLGCAVSHKLLMDEQQLDHNRILADANSIDDPDRPMISLKLRCEKKRALTLEKYIAYADTRRINEKDLEAYVKNIAEKSAAKGFQKLYDEQKKFMEDFWHHSQVRITGDLSLQQGLHFNIFQLLQSAGRDGYTSVSAKGVSGEGYEGHYFWDTEMYILPFFLHTLPWISRAFLEYRYRILPQARQRAREMGHESGALFAWRTINGNECSAYYPAGTAQYHINADIAYAVSRYLDSTDDDDFLWDMGAEILFETAELWQCLGFYNPQHENRFCIQGVTGPDEYNVLVDNNYYTNLMAQANLSAAAAAAARMKQERPDRYAELADRLKLNLDERSSLWQQAADSMYFPYDEQRSICLQDEDFLGRLPWDFEHTEQDKYPLLLHYHPLVIYRHRVCKQADMVLAQMMHSSHFSIEDKKRAYNYYEACTTHDSSLSASIHAVMACELGYVHKAYRYFMQTARLDLENHHQNTVDGLHLANMAGTWMVMVNGYAGLRVEKGRLYFSPQISKHWESYQFRLVHNGCLINVAVNSRQAVYTLIEGTKLEFNHFGRAYKLDQNYREIQLSLEEISTCARGPLKAVIFDVDGVLLSTDEQHYLAWKQLADEEGIYFDHTINGRLRGVSRMQSLDIILEKADRTYSEEEKQALAERKNNNYRELISKITPDDVLPGVIKCLDAFKELGLRLATGSSSKNAPELLRRTGLAGYFEATADGNEISRSKPDPEVFLVAANKLKLDPGSCLVVEDAVSGIEAAKAGGFRSLAVGDAARNSLLCDPDALEHSLKFLEPEDVLDIC
ncbi:MAG: beta-phosphoglucomutase [Clostridiaceae bacterium]|nr:beta-phosphoglucomutase [Clostridiaceae bacterium]